MKRRHIVAALIIGAFIGLFLVVGCRGSEYTTQHFSFPPGSKPHENDWEYTALVIVTSNQSPMTVRSKKKVTIKIYDRNKTAYLNEEFEFDSASIKANVVWNKFEDFNVDLSEVGNEYAKDAYNNHLLKTGPNELSHLEYKYSREDRRFKRMTTSSN